MGWPLPLHVLIKITRECKKDFLNASCLFYFCLSCLPLSLVAFLGGPGLVRWGWVGSSGISVERTTWSRVWAGFLLLLLRLIFLFRHPSERDFLFSLVMFPLFLALLLGWVTWFGDRDVHDGPA